VWWVAVKKFAAPACLGLKQHSHGSISPKQCGELGLGHKTVTWFPTAVPVAWTDEPSSFFRTSQVACGADHTLALVMYHGKLIPCATGEQNALVKP
jgi:hypothetical protein